MTENTTIALKWKELASRKQIFSIERGTSGVYIWGFYNDNFVPYQVGKATGSSSYSDIRCRLWSHVTSILGGEYSIHKKDKLRNFYKFKDRDKLNELEHHFDFTQCKFDKFVKERCGNLKEHIDEMIDNFYFTYAQADKEYVADLEKSIINIIGIDKLWNIRGGEPKKFVGRNEDLKKIIQF